MSAPPFMPFFVGDYLADTTHLTVTEHGAYLLLLMSMWRNGGSLPADDRTLARHARCTTGQWSRMRPVLMPFFKASDTAITQARLASELTKHSDAVEQQRQRSSNGGKAKALKYKEPGLPAATVRQCQPEPEPIEEEAKASLSPEKATTYPEPFEAAWKAYPHIKGRSSKPKALGCWRRMTPAARDALPSAVARYARDGREPRAECGAPAMQRWLADARFEDWMTETRPPEPARSIDPAIRAGRLHHLAKTGEWRPDWGPRPANDRPEPHTQDRAA